jgi:hypothetical protein
MKPANGKGDPPLEKEAVDQLHHADDRRDAAKMRIEELVREVEFGEERRESSRATPLLIIGLAVTAVGALFLLLWLRSLCL